MAPNPWKAAALAALVLAVAGRSQTLEMQVEEPVLASPPIDPDRDIGPWKGPPANPTLSKAQRIAYEKRRKLVESLAAEVRAKREALLHSTDADRADRVKELEELILDPAVDADRLNRLEQRLEKQAEAKARSLEKKLEKLENKAEKSIEKKQDKLDKELDALDKQLTKDKVNTGK